MTEREWLSSIDPMAMLRSLLARYTVQQRRGETPELERLRLFACACCRRVWDILDDDHRQSIKMIERYVRDRTPNGLRAARKTRWAAGNAASNEYDRLSRAVPRDRRACLLAWARNVASSAVWQAADKNPARAANCHRQVAEAVHSLRLAEGSPWDGPDPGHIGYRPPSDGDFVAQADVLRQVVGNPFVSRIATGA
jgi:hypothetical protein